MKQAAIVETPEFRVVNSSLMMKVFYGFAVLAAISVAITIAGSWFGHEIAMGGHTDDTTVQEVVIGNNVIAAPANIIRFDRARRSGIASRLDLYLRYPQMDGYSDATADDFNDVGPRHNILFLSFEEQMMSRGMSERFDPIYSALIVQPGKPGPNGITFYDFTKKSGYMSEILAVAERPGQSPFVARCLSGQNAAESLAPCERDFLVGDNLSLTYRFPRALLDNWKALDAAVIAKTSGFLKTGATISGNNPTTASAK